MSVLVYTTATFDYEHFVLPFAFFVLANSNHDVIVEVGVENPSLFTNNECLIFINDLFGADRLTISYAQSDLSPGTSRFVTQPTRWAKYIYISDVDILHLENNEWPTAHIRHMVQTGLPYSNGLRNQPAEAWQLLSGLHFSLYDAYYPLPDLSDLNLKTRNMRMYFTK